MVAFEPATPATAPVPCAMLLSPLAIAFEPVAIEPLPVALADGPIATLSVPVALLSGCVEFAWKYLMPAPLLMFCTEFVTESMAWLVAFSCAPLTASVLVALTAPAATLVIFCGALLPWLAS